MIEPIALVLCLGLATSPPQEPEPRPSPPSAASVREAGRLLLGIEFTDAELELMLGRVEKQIRSYERLRAATIGAATPPAAAAFSPLSPAVPPRADAAPSRELSLPAVERPADLEDLAFADIPTLASLVRAKKVSCEELARMFLARLKRVDAALACVITYTEDRALASARALDREIAAGRYRGPLHGIPYGVKDLLATRGYRTTWGAKLYENQVIDLDATVVRKLDEAGAVLIAKLSVGELAWGDVWFGGQTKNPWKPSEGSDGSSAGSAAATAAGGVPFSIGTETMGSIVMPSARCGCSALRPTFGRVSRHGSMTVAWSLDRIGPLCRTAGDTAIVLEAIAGPDGLDATVVANLPFRAESAIDVLRGVRVGVVAADFERSPAEKSVIGELKALGAEIVPVTLPADRVDDLVSILWCEAAAAFDDLTRSGRDDLLARQGASAWPNILRSAQLVPAVEYLRASRVRASLQQDVERVMSTIDVLVHPTDGNDMFKLAAFTGHPAVAVPSGFTEEGTPRSVTFTGQLFGEAKLVAIAAAWQRSTGHHLRRPKF